MQISTFAVIFSLSFSVKGHIVQKGSCRVRSCRVDVSFYVYSSVGVWCLETNMTEWEEEKGKGEKQEAGAVFPHPDVGGPLLPTERRAFPLPLNLLSKLEQKEAAVKHCRQDRLGLSAATGGRSWSLFLDGKFWRGGLRSSSAMIWFLSKGDDVRWGKWVWNGRKGGVLRIPQAPGPYDLTWVILLWDLNIFLADWVWKWSCWDQERNSTKSDTRKTKLKLHVSLF